MYMSKKWKSDIKRLQIHGITADDPLWLQFKGASASEGKPIAKALKEAILLYLQRSKSEYRFMPVLAKVPAGSPSDVEELEFHETVPVPSSVPPSACILRVQGRSMEPTLNHGDYVIVKPFETYSTIIDDYIGKVIVANNDFGEYTIKRLKKEGEIYILSPDNKNYDDIPLEDGEWYLWGAVVGRLRIDIEVESVR